MSRYEKLIEKICNIDKGLRFEQLEKVLLKIGYCVDCPGSSHYTFRKQGRVSITIPRHEPIKPYYIKRVKEILETEGLL